MIILDKEFQALIPPLSAEEKAQLEENIVAEGCRDALITWQGILLDGHNRYEICERLDIPYRTISIDLPDRDAAEDWIDKNQLGRRNLTPDQMSLLRGRRYNRAKKAPHRPEKGDQNDPLNPQKTADRLAKEHGVSPATIKRDGKIAAFMDEHPEEANAVIRGEKNLKDVKKEIRRSNQIEKETAAVEATPKDTSPLWTVTADQSVIKCSALITDPPYGILTETWEPGAGGIEDVTRLWATRWAQCGADFILTFFSQRFMWQGKKWFDESFAGYEFQQLLIWHYPNNKSPQSRQGFKQTWEPIFFYRRRDSKKQIRLGGNNWTDGLNDFDCHVAAVPQSNFNDAETKVHPAQKPVSVMRWLINATTNPGEMVADPFMGSGTTGIAASQLNRKFHGIEIDNDMRATAEKRIVCYGKI